MELSGKKRRIEIKNTKEEDILPFYKELPPRDVKALKTSPQPQVPVSTQAQPAILQAKPKQKVSEKIKNCLSEYEKKMTGGKRKSRRKKYARHRTRKHV